MIKRMVENYNYEDKKKEAIEIQNYGAYHQPPQVQGS